MTPPTLLHQTRWLSLYDRNTWVFASRRHPGEAPRVDAVNVVAFHEADGVRRLVVTEEWRTAIATWEFSFPAGLIERGEDPQRCAARELAEETGLASTWFGPVSGRLFSSAGVTDESFVFVFCGCTGTPALHPGVDGEQIRVHLLDRAGCAALLARSTDDAALSGRLWPVLFNIVETGRLGSYELT